VDAFDYKPLTALLAGVIVLASSAAAIDLRSVSLPPGVQESLGSAHDVEPSLSPPGADVAATVSNIFLGSLGWEYWPHVGTFPIDGGSGWDSSEGGWATSPDWSPDGTQIVYAVRDPWNEQVEIRAAQHDPPGPLPNPLAAHFDASHPSWSPNGAQVAYNATGSIWIQHIVAAFLPPGSIPPRPIAVVGNARSVSWGPGNRFAYVRDEDLWVLDASAGTPALRLTSGSARDRDPEWSPDGEWIAFSSDRSGNWDIWVTSATGDRTLQVTTDPADDVHPSWSGDSKTLAFASDRGGTAGVWLATDLPDFSTPIETRSWSAIKLLYR
jgi:dipeptidyl aminopeptidase/acylaminoacyl peptidase